MDDLRVLADLFESNDFMVKFDLKSACHHVAIADSHRKYLGFQWNTRYFWFCALPFGLATAPFIFNKITKPLIVHWRKQGFKAFLYFDDGTAAAASCEEAEVMAGCMQSDLKQAGFIVNEAKSQWKPAQTMEVLGYEIDLTCAVFRATQAKCDRVVAAAQQLVDRRKSVRARAIASFVGLIQSLRLAIGPSTSLWTRSLYSKLAEVSNMDHHLHLSQPATKELRFWLTFFGKQPVQFPIKPVNPKVEVLTYSDASNMAWGGFCAHQGAIAQGNFSIEEQGPRTSSTWREVYGMRKVIESLISMLSNRIVLHRTDNQNVVRVVKSGSRVPAIQQEVIQLTEVCQEYCVHLVVEWIPRDLNVLADMLSKQNDRTDYQLCPEVFRQLDVLWGPHTLDCFASDVSKHCERYCSRTWNPGCWAANAFTIDWCQDNCWLFPPTFLIGSVLRFAKSSAAHCSLLIPNWPAQPWWVLLFSHTPTSVRPNVISCLEIPLRPGLILDKGSGPVLFTDGPFTSSMLAVRLCFV